MSKWYNETGSQGDVVISTRIRFARNLNSFPFPCKLSEKQKVEVINLVKNVISEDEIGKELKYVDLRSLSKVDRISLVERHITSPNFVEETYGRGLFLSDDESVSIMINEDKKLSFAFDDNLGYLTQCPTNLGTGMRASVMLHLPALRESGVMEKISSNLSKLGLVLRGIYGEGTEPKADFYQLSNQVTLGLSEKASIKNLEDVTMQLISQERNARGEMIKHIEFIDLIHRSYGVLKNARLLSNNEFMKLISNVRLGAAAGEIKDFSLESIDSLIIKVQPAMLSLEEKKDLTANQREQLRAEIIRNALNKEQSD